MGKDNEIENHVCGYLFPKGISKDYGLANKVSKKALALLFP